MTSFANERVFRVGNFEAIACKNFKKHQNIPGVSLKLILGNGEKTTNYDQIDIGSLQAKPENRGATFQVASNFNCLEFVSENGSAKEGITKYVADYTQGPTASISAAPGTLYRNYFLPHKVDNKEYVGQLQKQINLLDNIKLLNIKNGYVFLQSDNEWNNIQNSNFNFNDPSLIKVGVHRLVEVTSGQKRNGSIDIITNKNQLINQVFTAAMSMDTVSGKWRNSALSENIAKFILRGAYRGTILAAIDNSRTLNGTEYPGKNRCFLTMIGGGVFGNKYEWILDCILEQQDIIVGSGLEIIFVCYARNSIDDIGIIRLQSFFQGFNAKCDIVYVT